MKNKIISVLSEYKFRSLFAINFTKFMLFVFAVLVIISFLIYENSTYIINSEFAQSNLNNVQKISDIADTIIKEVQTISSHLSLDRNVQLYLSTKNPEQLIEEFNLRMKDKISMFTAIYEYIDSVYIYSEKSDCIFSSDGNYTFDKFSDLDWMPKYKESSDNFAIWPREMHNSYPYVITIMKRITTPNSMGAIIININLRNLGVFFDSVANKNQEAFIIDDNNSVIYNKNMEKMFNSISNYHVLSELFQQDNAIIITKDKQTYAAAKQRSKYYNWTYSSIKHLSEYSERLESNNKFIISIIIVSLFIGLAVAIFLTFSTYRPVRGLIDLLDDPEKGKGEYSEKSSDEIKYIAQRIINTVNVNTELQNELKEQFDMLNKAKICALQLQINPHFLFNTINLISLMIVDDFGFDHPSSNMLSSVADILRYVLETDEEIVDIASEIKYNKLYIEILDKRYGGKFKTEWNIDTGILNSKIPKLCLQPIIENAVHHGLSPLENAEGILTITGFSKDEMVTFVISDNGSGIQKEILDEINESLYNDVSFDAKHIGIKNIHQRIQLMFGKKYGLQIESEVDKGTIVTLVLPFIG